MATQVYQIASLLDDMVAVVDAARATTTDQSWLNAITSGYSWLLEQDSISFDAEKGELLFVSESSIIYRCNGTCADVETGQPCKAFARNNACRHRAAARITRRAIERAAARAAHTVLIITRCDRCQAQALVTVNDTTLHGAPRSHRLCADCYNAHQAVAVAASSPQAHRARAFADIAELFA